MDVIAEQRVAYLSSHERARLVATMEGTVVLVLCIAPLMGIHFTQHNQILRKWEDLATGGHVIT